jgi:hypothetical protein
MLIGGLGARENGMKQVLHCYCMVHVPTSAIKDLKMLHKDPT